MREIKFRAWDEDVKEMVTLEEHLIHEKENNYEVPKKHNTKLGSFFYRFFDCDIMQYTGLEDKNGVEIYEGDIVTYENDNKYKYVVEYINGECKFFACGLTRTQSENNLGYKICDRLTVIGNIYENKELLK